MIRRRPHTQVLMEAVEARVTKLAAQREFATCDLIKNMAELENNPMVKTLLVNELNGSMVRMTVRCCGRNNNKSFEIWPYQPAEIWISDMRCHSSVTFAPRKTKKVPVARATGARQKTKVPLACCDANPIAFQMRQRTCARLTRRRLSVSHNEQVRHERERV